MQQGDGGKASAIAETAVKYPPTKRRVANHPPADDQRNPDDASKTKRR